jgi:hypothetical protein
MTTALLLQLYRSSSLLGRMRFDSKQKLELAYWINSNTPSDVTVMVEPLGMIGYYADRRFDDYPGLASSRVTDAVKQLGRRMSGTPVDYQALNHILLMVKPDILILREKEYEINKIHGSLECYQLVFVSPIPREITAKYGDLQSMLVLTRRVQPDTSSAVEEVDLP